MNLEAVYSVDDAATIRPRGKEPITKEGNTDGAAVEISSGVRDDDASSANVTRSRSHWLSKESDLRKNLKRWTFRGTAFRAGSPSSPSLPTSTRGCGLSGTSRTSVLGGKRVVVRVALGGHGCI